MLDLKAVRKDPAGIAEQLLKRDFVFDTALFADLDARRKQADVDSQNLLAERKSASKKIGALIGQGMSVEANSSLAYESGPDSRISANRSSAVL